MSSYDSSKSETNDCIKWNKWWKELGSWYENWSGWGSAFFLGWKVGEVMNSQIGQILVGDKVYQKAAQQNEMLWEGLRWLHLKCKKKDF